MSKEAPGPFFVLRAHEGAVTALHFVSDKEGPLQSISDPVLLSGSIIGEILCWNLKVNRVQFQLSKHDGKMILWLFYVQNSILSQGRDGYINIWKCGESAIDWVITRKIQSPDVGFCKASLFCTDFKLSLVVPSDDKGGFNIIDYDTEDTISKLETSLHGMCMCIKIVKWKNKNFAFCGYEDGSLILWDCNDSNEYCALKCHEEPLFCLDVDLEHRCCGVSGSADSFLQIWRIEEQYKLSTEQQIELPISGVNTVAVRSDGKILLTGGWDGNIRVFSWRSLRPLAVLKFHVASLLSFEFSSQLVDKHKSVFATGSKDSNIALWTIY